MQLNVSGGPISPRWNRTRPIAATLGGALLPVLTIGMLATPLAFIIGTALQHGDALSPLIHSERIARLAQFTITQATLSTLLALVLGIFIALLVSYAIPGSRVLLVLTGMTFALPTMVVAAAWTAMRIPAGMVAIVSAHAFFNAGLVARFLVQAQGAIPADRHAIARTLGMSPREDIRWVWWPGVRHAAGHASAIVAALSVTSLGIITTLAAERQGTFETEIVRRGSDLSLLPSAAWLGIAQMLLLLPMLYWGRNHVLIGGATPSGSAIRPTSPRIRGVLRLAVLLLSIAWMFPLALLFLDADWNALTRIAPLVSGSSVGSAVWGSIRAAILAVPIAMLLAVGCVLSRSWVGRLGALLSNGMFAVSSALIGFGMLMTFRYGPVDLRTSVWLIPIAQALIGLPFATRILQAAVATIPQDEVAMARTLGARRILRFRIVEWPTLAGSMRAATGMIALIAIGDFSATLFIALPDQPTLPLLIHQCFSRPGFGARGAGIAAALLLLGICACIALLTFPKWHMFHTRPRQRRAQ